MRLDGRRGRHEVGLGDRPPVGDFEQRVEQQREPATARVDHAGLAQHGQEIGRLQDGRARRVHRSFQHRHERAARASRLLDGLGRLAHDRQDRALDRSQHRLVRGVGGPAQRVGDVVGADARQLTEDVGEAAQDLGGDDARVATRAHERTPADRLAHLRHGLGGAELRAHRLERERHVRARVAVGDGVDVEPVQLFLVGPQGVAITQHRLAQIGGPETGQGRHRAGD